MKVILLERNDATGPFQVPREESGEQTVHDGDYQASLFIGATRERLSGNCDCRNARARIFPRIYYHK